VPIKTGNYQRPLGLSRLAVFLFPSREDTEMAIYIVAMESADGQKTASICATGRTRRECIQNAVDEASARDGMAYRATATTNLKGVVGAPLLPPTPSPRRIYASPKPRHNMQVTITGQCQRCGKTLNGPEPTSSSLTNTPDGRGPLRQHWHLECWRRHAAER